MSLKTMPKEKIDLDFLHKKLCDSLSRYSFARTSKYVRDSLANELLDEAKRLQRDGKLKDAGMNKGNYLYRIQKKHRGDKMLWVTSLSDSEVANCFKLYLKEMRKLREKLNFGIPGLCLDGKISIQLAFYPGGGARYLRHFDAFKPSKEKKYMNGQTRKITAILYLNPGWNEDENGGELRSYFCQPTKKFYDYVVRSNDKNEHYIDTSPLFNNLVLFFSDTIEHEVLPCNTNRYALTCWFYTKDENYCKSSAAVDDTETSVVGKRFPSLENDLGHKIQHSEVFKNFAIQTNGFLMLRPGDLNSEKLPFTYPIPDLPLLVDSNKYRHKTIFVSIPSYRDPECQYTIQNLFQAATFPERIFVGVCMQYDRVADTNCFVLPPQRPNQIRMLHMDHRDAKGPCYARFMVEKLYNQEDFVLQIDSHMRLRPNWDTFLIDRLNSCPSAKPVITGYPVDYFLPNTIPHIHVTTGTLLCASCFDKDGILRLKGRRFNNRISEKSSNGLVQSFFWASGFSFCKGTVYNEVPYDPLPYLFFGEEAIMGARLWTSGYDFYSTTDIVAYHLWSRANRPVFQQHLNKEKDMLKSESRRIVLEILSSAETEKYKSYAYHLGKSRTLSEFENYIGVSFRDHTLSAKAKLGGQDVSIFQENIDEPSDASSDNAAKTDVNLDALIQNVMHVMKKRGDI